jgi:sugar-specific transcriptional regulator TrmB
MDISILKKIGLSDKEIKVYLKLLEYGAVSVRSLAELTELNRGTTYDILKKLQEAGLVSYFHQDTKQRFVAEDPEKIIKLLDNEKNKLEEAREKIHDLIPELKSLQDKGGSRPVTKFYEGKEGIRFILEDILSRMNEEKEKEYYVYSAAGVREDVGAAYPDFSKKRVKLGIKTLAISLAEGGKTYGLDERKWIAPQKNAEKNMTYIIIYAGKCAFISLDSQGSPVGVMIENQMVYDTQRTIFLELWRLISQNKK